MVSVQGYGFGFRLELEWFRSSTKVGLTVTEHGSLSSGELLQKCQLSCYGGG